MEIDNMCDHIPCEIVWKKPEYYAELFSDGCESLKELLLLCFEKKISTYICSNGKKEDFPYMLFFMYQEDRDIMCRILAKLYSVGEGHTIQLIKMPDKNYIALNVTQFSPWVDYYIHDLLREAIAEKEKVQLPKEIKSIIKILDNHNHPSLGLKFEYRYLYKLNQMEYKVLIGSDVLKKVGFMKASTKIISANEINEMVEGSKVIR